ncbi:hypothetical protein EPI10_030480 [Gossypium australe]|uniref:Uncharacterized protein n=1 Tax=Gossypium australe TaxID=47621 RepID=A0A5B6WXA1_9ROSI|nr:hypothetical protein EPI10_030480 [Gossypium australe]
MKDLGDIKYFLSIKIMISKFGIVLNQCKYALDLIADMKLKRGKVAVKPLKQNQKVHHDEKAMINVCINSLLRGFLYLTCTRLNIYFVVQHLSQFMQQPKRSHYEAVIRIVQSLKKNPGRGSFFCCSWFTIA